MHLARAEPFPRPARRHGRHRPRLRKNLRPSRRPQLRRHCDPGHGGAVSQAIAPPNNRFVSLLTALSENTYLSAVRAGMVAVVPLTIIGALICVRVQKFFTDWNLVIKLPASVPQMVYESFLSLIPLAFLVLVFWIIRYVAHVDINHLVQKAFEPLLFALNTLPGILVYAFLVTLLWSVGINGDNALDAIVSPIFLTYLLDNSAAMSRHQPLPY